MLTNKEKRNYYKIILNYRFSFNYYVYISYIIPGANPSQYYKNFLFSFLRIIVTSSWNEIFFFSLSLITNHERCIMLLSFRNQKTIFTCIRVILLGNYHIYFSFISTTEYSVSTKTHQSKSFLYEIRQYYFNIEIAKSYVQRFLYDVLYSTNLSRI